jgi:glycosyltransferase involved in cell wall biosynthesis
MRVGIVTPAYNVAPYIGDAIRSVLSQTHQAWTMTIVDDGSTDATTAVVAGFDDPRLCLIRQRNAGVSAARNRGVTATYAEAVLFLDADDWLSPDALALLTAALSVDSGAIAAVGPYSRVPDSPPNGSVLGRRARSRIVRPASGDLLEALLVRNLFANGGHLLIRRGVLDAAGPFRSGLRYGEDWEYWTRLARSGTFTAVETPTPLLFVRERHGSAYLGMATRPESFIPCMDAIFNVPALRVRFGPAVLARMRRSAEAENDWIVGRELIRHGSPAEGRRFLRRSVRGAPGLRRLALLAAGSLPWLRVGPFRRYPAL